jgi:hypothetical protein
MTSPTRPPAVLPPPDLVPILPEMSPDAILLGLAVDEAMESDIRIGVSFGTRRVYCYLSPPLVHVGSIVVVPPSIMSADPQTADVVTLDPPPYAGPVKRVLAVLS